MLERMDFLIQQLAVTNPEHRLADMDMVTYQDLTKKWEWNSPVSSLVDQCVHDIIQEHVDCQPNALAV